MLNVVLVIGVDVPRWSDPCAAVDKSVLSLGEDEEEDDF
jgi:hypothetical protein